MSSKFSIPKSQILKIIRETIPENQLVKSEVTEFCSKAAVIFVMYLAATLNENRKNSIDEQTVIQALKEIGFGDWEEKIKDIIKLDE